MVRGKEDWLFEDVYVKDHYESMMYNYTNDTAEMRKIFETEALRLWKVQELLKEYDIHIFVSINPGKDMITVSAQTENAVIRFYDMQGHLLIAKPFDFNTTVNTGDWTPGMYFWEIWNSTQKEASGKWMKT